MTVISISGSSLDEVWGETTSKPKNKRKSTKQPSDPVCEKKSSNYDDIMDYYHPSIHGIYEKSRYSRTQKKLTDTDADDRYDENVNVSGADEDLSQKLPPKFREHYSDINYQSPTTDHEREKQYLDLSMYIFSGIALIFILEQFVSLGMALASKTI